MSQRRNLNVFDVLGLIDDGNDSDVGDLLSEDDSDSDNDYTPNDETDNDDESEWDDNDDIPLQQLQAAAADSQPPKRRRGDTNNYTWRKRHMNLLILHSKEIHLIIQRKSARHINIFSNLLTAK